MANEYWRRRAAEFEREWSARCESELERDLARYFRESLSEIEKDIAALYGKYMKDNALSYREARRLIRGSEFAEWRMSLREYVEAAHTDSAILKELNTLAMRSRITRLEKLYSETLRELQKLGERSESAVKDFLTTAYRERYYHGIYDLASVGKLSVPVSKVEPQRLEKVLAQRWQGGNYSSRIWKDTERLSKVLKQTITSGLHRGLSVDKMSKALAKEMGASYKNAERLVRTEMNFVQNHAAKESLESAGLREYEFIAVLDHRTSQRCQNLDGTVHLLEEYDPGTNAPPMHPRCRSTISAVISEGTRTAKVRGKSIRVPADMKYGDYKAVYIDKTTTLKRWELENELKRNAEAAKPENVRQKIKEKQVWRKVANGEPLTVIPLYHNKILDGFPIFDPTTETIAQCLKRINPNYTTGEYQWTHNCQRCVMAYELRRRGYDVTVKPSKATNVKENMQDNLIQGGKYLRVFKNPQPLRIRGDTVGTIEQCLKSWGAGSRAAIHVTWKKGGGHVFVAENVDGKILFIDPQTGEIGVQRYFNGAKPDVKIVNRMDNCWFTNLILDCCEGVKP